MVLKRFQILFTVILACVLALGCFTGCAKSDVEVILDAISEKLDCIKNLEGETIEEIKNDLDSGFLEAYGLSGDEFLQSYFDNFDYEINDIVVDGDTAQATVTMTCKSFSAFQELLNESISEFDVNERIWSMSEEELTAYLGDLIMEAINSTKVTTTNMVIIDYNKVDDSWVSTEESSSTIVNAILTN